MFSGPGAALKTFTRLLPQIFPTESENCWLAMAVAGTRLLVCFQSRATLTFLEMVGFEACIGLT
jgi:hypothetical protein